MLWIFVVLFVISFATAVYFFSSSKNLNKLCKENQQKIEDFNKEKISYLIDLGKYEQQKEIIREKDLKLDEFEKKIDELGKELGKLQSQITAIEKDKQHIIEEKEKLEKIQEKLISASKQEFQTIAAELLKMTKTELTTTNKEEIKNVVAPYKEELKSFKEVITKQTSEFNQTKGSLENELKNVINQGNQLKEQTTNLIDMFKTDSKAKGDFGENVLHTILERSNLQEGVNYFVQQQEGGKRTDFQILLPGNKWIVIDSKVPLSAYMNYCNAKLKEEKDKFLEEHVKVIKSFINDLAGKKYPERFEKDLKTISPDFTMMFVYPEEAYIAALRYRETLTNEAWSKNIAIVSATSLIHTIKIIEKLWDVQRQVENHEKIIKLAEKFKDKLFVFVEYIGDICTSIETLNKNYNKLQANVAGKGGLQKLVEELSEYGIKSSNNNLNLDKIKEIKSIENKLIEDKR